MSTNLSKSTPTTIDVVYDPHGPAWTVEMRGGRPRIILGPTAADTSYHARRLTLWLLQLVEGISGAEHGARLDELIEHEPGEQTLSTDPAVETHVVVRYDASLDTECRLHYDDDGNGTPVLCITFGDQIPAHTALMQARSMVAPRYELPDETAVRS